MSAYRSLAPCVMRRMTTSSSKSFNMRSSRIVLVDHPEEDHEFTDWKALADAVEAFLKTTRSLNIKTNVRNK